MRSRLALFLVAMVLWAAAISARLVQLQVVDHEKYRQQAMRQQQQEVELAPPRGTIFDARGHPLAVSMAVDSAYVLPKKIVDAARAAEQIASVVDLDVETIHDRLTDSRRWLWLARQLDPPVAQALRDLEIEGVGFVEESKRFYPLEELAGPVLGFVGTDHSGLAGLEAAYNQVVSGETVRRHFLRDALNGGVVAPGFSFIDAEPGANLYLTIDASVQHIVEAELARALEESRAKAGVVVLMRPRTGAILAMASLPTYNPNRFGDYPPARWRNAAVEAAFEPGSTFKAVTATAALESNLIDPLDVIDCQEGGITLGSIRIRDHKPFGRLSFRDVIARSSNVGVIKVGMRLEPSTFSEQVRKFGFGLPTGIDLPGENAGIVRGFGKWSRYEAAYLSIGQGLSATPVQLVRAFGALANDGIMVEPYLVAAIDRGGLERTPVEQEPEALASPSTIRTLTRLLEAVVEDGGGSLAAVPGYRVAGKTGTAQKALPGIGYLPDRHVASFLGFVPSRSPEIVALVMLDEPRGRFYGGEVAAPVFGSIMKRVLPLLAIAPGLEENFEAPLEEEIPAGLLIEQAPRLARSMPLRDASLEQIDPGAVPDVLGLTAREAIRVLAARGLMPRLHGSGFVENQAPAAGEPLELASGEVEIWLGANS